MLACAQADMTSAPGQPNCLDLLRDVCPERKELACAQTTVADMLRVCHGSPPDDAGLASPAASETGVSFLVASIGYGAPFVNAPALRPNFDAARHRVDPELSHSR